MLPLKNTQHHQFRSSASIKIFDGQHQNWKTYKRSVKDYAISSYYIARLLHTRPNRLSLYVPQTYLQPVTIVNPKTAIPLDLPGSTLNQSALAFSLSETTPIKPKRVNIETKTPEISPRKTRSGRTMTPKVKPEEQKSGKTETTSDPSDPTSTETPSDPSEPTINDFVSLKERQAETGVTLIHEKQYAKANFQLYQLVPTCTRHNFDNRKRFSRITWVTIW